MNIELIKDVLTAIIHSVYSTLTVIDQNQYAPRPKPPYIVLSTITRGVKTGTDEQRLIDDVIYVSGHRDATLQVEYLGVDAAEKLGNILDRFDFEYVTEYCASSGIAIIDTGDIIDLTQKLENKFDERATFDVTIRYSIGISEDQGAIEHVELNGNTIDK